MTSIKGLKEDLPKDAEYEGCLFYVATHATGSAIPLYRFITSGDQMDHMDSLEPAVEGYRVEGVLGYTFTSPSKGMAPLERWAKVAPLDHLTGFDGEVPEGYYMEGTLGYGYPRFGEDDSPQKKHHPVLRQVLHKGVTLKADVSWGGVIYELWWDGKQFVNHHDCGREIQTALFKPGLTDLAFGPTEAGDRMYHGSPVADIRVTERSLYTRSLPLQWGPENHGGGEHRPVLYGGEFERLALFLPHASLPLILYRVGYKPAESTLYAREWATAYLTLEVSERFFLFAPEGGVEEIPVPPNGGYVSRSIETGAVIAASKDLRYALGFFVPAEANVTWWNFDKQGSESANTRKINVWDTDQVMEEGIWYRRNLYLLVGTLDMVLEACSFLSEAR